MPQMLTIKTSGAFKQIQFYFKRFINRYRRPTKKQCVIIKPIKLPRIQELTSGSDETFKDNQFRIFKSC